MVVQKRVTSGRLEQQGWFSIFQADKHHQLHSQRTQDRRTLALLHTPPTLHRSHDRKILLLKQKINMVLPNALNRLPVLPISWRVNLQVEPVHGLGKVAEVELVLGEIPLFPRGRELHIVGVAARTATPTVPQERLLLVTWKCKV